MAIEIGKLRITASTLQTNDKFRSHWHVTEMRGEAGDKDLRDQPVAGTFDTEQAARDAAMAVGTAYANELLEKNPHLRGD